MSRSTKATRVQAEVTLTGSDLPASGGDSITFALTNIPARGIVHRSTFILGKTSAFGGTADLGGAYVHTSGTAGAGVTPLSAAEALTIIAQAALSPAYADEYGAQLAIGSNLYVWAPSLDFGQSLKAVTGAGPFDSSGHPGFYYDVSGTTLGPNGTGTLYITWIGASVDFTTNISFAKFRADIEPAS